MNYSKRAFVRFILFFFFGVAGVNRWYRLIILQQLMLQRQASYFWAPAWRKFAEEDYEGSLNDFYRLLWLDPSNTEVETYIDTLNFHLATHREQNFPSSVTMGLEEMDSVIYNNRGSIRSTQGDWQGAIADYTQSLNLRSDSVAAYTNRGRAYLEVGDRSNAEADLKHVAELWQAFDKTDW